MSDTEFQTRLARIAAARAPQPAAAPVTPVGGASGSRKDRLKRSLSVASAAGISPAMCFPPAMRGLAMLGVPVRPLHFNSLAGLFLMGLGLGVAVFGGVLWFVTLPGLGAPERGPIAGLVSLGWPGVWVVSGLIGVAFAVLIKMQAAQAGLPRWRDL